MDHSIRKDRAGRSRIVAWVAAALLAFASIQPTAVEAAAKGFRARYEAGLKLYKAKMWKEALVEFQAAYGIEADAAALYSIARCHDKLGALPAAIEAYERYLEKWPKHKGEGKAKGYLVEALVGLGHGKLAAVEHEAALAAFARARDLHDVGKTKDATAGRILAGLGEATSYVGTEVEAVALLERALATELPAAERKRAEALVAKLAARPTPPVPDTGEPTEPALLVEPDEPAPVVPESLGIEPGGPTHVSPGGPTDVPAAEPGKGKKKKGLGVGGWLGIGGGALVVVGAAVAIPLAVVLTNRSWNPDLGDGEYYFVEF